MEGSEGSSGGHFAFVPVYEAAAWGLWGVGEGFEEGASQHIHTVAYPIFQLGWERLRYAAA